jgi:hypothetical protein
MVEQGGRSGGVTGPSAPLGNGRTAPTTLGRTSSLSARAEDHRACAGRAPASSARRASGLPHRRAPAGRSGGEAG